jgi:hypothetical protein
MVSMSVAPISQASSVRFAVAARVVSEHARMAGLRVPAFKCPPRIAGAHRTVKRVGRDVVVAVQVKGRPFGAVIADLIEGVVVTNELSGVDAGRARALMWEGLDQEATIAA